MKISICSNRMLLVITMVSAVHCFGVELLNLVPDISIAVSKQIGRNDGTLKIRELRAGADGVWILLQSTERPEHLIVRSNLSGDARIVSTFPSSVRPIGLVTTGRGVATVLVQDRKPVLVEFSAAGQELMRSPVGCFVSDRLMAIANRPATICPDGKVTRYDESARTVEYSTWARPGAIAESLSNGQFAIVDQPSARVLLNDPRSGSVATLHGGAPEIEEARSKNAATYQAAMQAAATGMPKPGQPLTVMDTASDGTGFYLLVWPFHESAGPAVVKFTNSGDVAGRYRCGMGARSQSSPHKIGVNGQFLFLGTVGGTIYRYKI